MSNSQETVQSESLVNTDVPQPVETPLSGDGPSDSVLTPPKSETPPAPQTSEKVKHAAKAVKKAERAVKKEVPTKKPDHRKGSHYGRQPMALKRSPKGTRPGRGAVFGNTPLPAVYFERRTRVEDFSHAYFLETVVLDSDRAQQLFESTTSWINVEFAVLLNVLPRFDKKAYDKLSAEHQKTLRQMTEDLTQRLKATKADLETYVPDEAHRVPNHDHQRTYVVPAHTPLTVQYITALRVFDKLVGRLEACFLVGLKSNDELQAEINELSKVILTFRRKVNSDRVNAIAQAKQNTSNKAELGRQTQLAEKQVSEVKVRVVASEAEAKQAITKPTHNTKAK